MGSLVAKLLKVCLMLTPIGFGLHIRTAHKDLLRWQGQGEVAAQRPESVTQIYISVVESVIRRFEADRHLSTTEDAKDLLPDFRTWSRAWMGIEEKSNG